MRKRVLGILICALMVMATLPAMAFADDGVTKPVVDGYYDADGVWNQGGQGYTENVLSDWNTAQAYKGS